MASDNSFPQDPGATGSQPSANEPGLDEQAEIDRALALLPDDQAVPEPPAPEAHGLEDYVTPEEWTSRGGMVEQQASAMDWLEHSADVRRESATQEFREAGAELTQEDREVIAAARAYEEAQTPGQDLGPTQAQDVGGP